MDLFDWEHPHGCFKLKSLDATAVHRLPQAARKGGPPSSTALPAASAGAMFLSICSVRV